MLISPDEISKSLSSRNWVYADKKISKLFKFESYMAGIQFVQNIAQLAENNNHHPDISISWCKVKISITSHEMGGVTTTCINLAIGIDSINI